MSGVESIIEGLRNRWTGRQAIVVIAQDEPSFEARMWLCERDKDDWRVANGPWPAVVGRNGVSKHAEGDGRSPSGSFLLGTAFGWAGKPVSSNYPYRIPDNSDRWVDDPESPFYNRWVRSGETVCGCGERLIGPEVYKHALVVHYNDTAVKGRGSAIFLHAWQGAGKPTAGCTAIPESYMHALMEWLDYSKRPMLVQGTEKQMETLLTEDWGMVPLPAGWGYVDDFIPDALFEIRYFTENNFTGRKLPGYLAPLAPMRLEALHALGAAAERLRQKNMGIRIFDAYRPQQATDAMIAWAADTGDTATKEEYYPGIDKRDIPGRFVARRSAHRLGGTVDLTIVDWESGCDLNMGGPFDFFGELSAFGYAGITQAQSRNRELLRGIMMEAGFEPYEREWWHFSFPIYGEAGEVPILPREHMIR